MISRKPLATVSPLLVIIAIAGSFFLSSCETEVDVNAPYKDITLIYGLLDQDEEIHFIKINKAYLGEGNAIDMAQIRDSSEYDPSEVTAILVELDRTSEQPTGVTFVLTDTTVSTKQPGVFYAPEQTVYKFEGDLNPDMLYRLDVDIREGSNKVSAITEMVQEFDFTGRIKQLPTVSMVSQTQFADEIPVGWASPRGGKRFQLKWVYGYTDLIVDGNDSTFNYHTIEWAFPILKSRNAEGGQSMEVTANGEDFYRLLRDNVPDFLETPNIVKRIPDDSISIVLTVGGEELDVYMEVKEPATGVAIDKPEYTNVNNGIGIFSCRNQIQLRKPLSEDSIEEMVTGEQGGYTGEKGFCFPNPSSPLDPNPCF